MIAPTITAPQIEFIVSEEFETGNLYFLPQDILKLHPKNIRRYYDPEKVDGMAQSIRKAKGVYVAMLVVADPDEPGKFLVVEGNMRLAGARKLGDDCPRLKCEIITADQAEQLLIMMVTTENMYPKDPISKALHYKRLIDEEGFTIRQIADAVGSHPRTIETHLSLLKLDEPIRELVGKKELSADIRATTALLSIPDETARISLARALAAKKAPVRQIEAAAGKLRADIAKQTGGKPAPEKKAGKQLPPLQEIKLFNALAAQMVAHFRKDAAMFEVLAELIGEQNPEIANGLFDRAEELRRIIRAATKERL